MQEEITLILTISFIIIFSPFLARVTKLLTTPVEIILGAILGYLGYLHHSELFTLIAEVGFLYLMFLAGTEINLKKILNIKADTLKNVIGYIFFLYVLSAAFTIFLDLGKILMVILPLISVGLVVTLSKEYGKTPWLELGMMAGAVGEVVSITVLSFSAAALQFGFGYELIQAGFVLGFFIFFIFLLFKFLQILFWWYPEVSTVLMPHSDNQEQDIRLSMGIFFILIAMMLYLKLELAFGAFIAGMFIPTFFEHKEELPEKLASYGFGFLIPIFFIHVGTLFDIKALSMDGLIEKAILITVIMILIRLLSSVVFIKELGFRDAMLVALSHSMPLTLLIAVATLAHHAQSIDDLHYYAFVLAALFEVIVVMSAIKLIQNSTTEKDLDTITTTKT
ncbi:MAG: cation:proton antiporter [Helicobacteraceae bacterium]|nr:cation:proton antiporter [Helicobacteraceae bacterium]